MKNWLRRHTMLFVIAMLTSALMLAPLMAFADNSVVPTAPTITPNGGSFDSAQSVTISSNNINGDKVYYTTDSSTPTTSSNLYNEPFTVSQSKVVHAAVYDQSSGWSGVASATFTITCQTPGNNSDQIAKLKLEFATAVSKNQMTKAMQILQKIKQLTAQNQNDTTINDLKQQLIDAVNNSQYSNAESILIKILKIEHPAWAYEQLGKIYQSEGKDQIPSVFANGNKINFNDVQPIIIKGRVMIPIRKLADTLGISDNNIKYNNGKVNIQNGKNCIYLTDNQNIIYKNKTAIDTDVAPQIINGRMLVPLRTINELLDKKVDWYQNGMIAAIEE